MGSVARVPPLHAAIWEGNAARVREMLDAASQPTNQSQNPDPTARVQGRNATAEARALLEAKDAHGNTALHLATRVVQPSQRAIVQLLLGHGANVSSRSADGWSCLHDATLCDDEFLLAQLFLQGERQLWSEVEEYQDDFLDALERLPDFEVEIFVEAYSWIPGVSKMLPSQTNRILKRGSQLRVDSSMKGLERFNLNHGNISHIFTGRADGGKAFMLNHDTKKYYDITSAVNGTSSLAKIDLGIHMLLTKELSATSINSSNLTFTKLKDIKEIKTKQKNGSTKRGCPWTGVKYEMKNVSATFSFRNPVNPKREHRKFAEDGIGAAEAAFGVIDGYVSELSLSSSKDTKRSGNAKSMMDTSIADEDDNKTPGASAGSDSDQELWLPKGQTMEMHLDVVAGDDISWTFSCNSKDYSFVATSYHDDVSAPVARCGAAKNASITGSYSVECNGSFVLKWLNTQKGFTLDKKGVKIRYKVTHARPPVAVPSSSIIAPPLPDHSAVGVTIGSGIEASAYSEQRATAASDMEICQQFQRLDHMPNPLTVVMPFNEYFSDDTRADTEKTKQDTNALSSLFKRGTKQPAKSPASASSPSVHSFTTFDGVEYRNTFRNLTLLPTPKRFHKNFEAKVFMAQDFPIQTKDFLPVIEFLSKTGDQVQNMAEFFRMKLPPGFPVRFELPMMFTVRAAYTFQKAVIRNDIDPSLFQLPEGYARVHSVKEILPQQS